MEHLLISGVGRTADDTVGISIAEILHMCQNHISRSSIVLVVLSASLRCHMGGQPSVNYDILFSSMLVHLDATNDKKAVTTV